MNEIISKQIKDLSLDILKDFDAFCKRYHLDYQLSFGTLLGAVRHQGYIPWDDDIDVDMPIEDYIRFRKLFLKHGDKEKYFLQTKTTDVKIPFPFYRLRLNNTTTTDPGEETFPIHWGLPLDIFPIYHSPNSKFFQNIQKDLFQRAMIHCQFDWNCRNGNRLKSFLHRYVTLLCLQGIYLISRFSRSSENVYSPYAYPEKNIGKKASLYPSKPITFEGVELLSYADPHAYLAWQFGEDYMTPPPEDKRTGHPQGVVDLEHDSEYYNGCHIRNK